MAIDFTLGFGVISVFDYRHVVVFNSNLKYDFDSSDGIDPDKLDFEAIAFQEIGHFIGFVSNAGVREAKLIPEPGPFGLIPAAPTIWDLYRFRPGVTMEDFDLAQRVQRSGGEQVFFTGDVEAPLASGAANATDWEGLNPNWLYYGRAASHWKDDALTGQYIGIMDESYLPGERGGITATDLTALSYFGYRINPGATVMEVLSVDDGSREQVLPPGNSMVVNRLTPARAPFNVESVRMQLPPLADGASVVGKRLRVVAFADAARSGQPPANPQYLVDRTITISALPENRMLEVMLPEPVTINVGDLYVGVQSVDGNLSFAADTNGEARNRSFVSNDNGASFQPLRLSGAAANAIVRAVVNARFNAVSNLVPEVKEISPTAAPTGSSFKLTIFGRNFFPDSADAAGVRYKSIIRINGQDKATEFLSLRQLRTEVSAADLAGLASARVTVATTTPNGMVESAPVELSVTPNAPIPNVLQIEPSTIAVGSPETKLIVTGRNFTAASAVRLNGVARPTKFINSTKLEVILPASDFSAALNGEIIVITPSPGGGASNAMMVRVAGCSYKLSQSNFLNLGTARRFTEDGVLNLHGVILETEDHCSWAAASSANWIDVADKQGKGRAPIGFNVLNNNTAAERMGTINVAGQTLTISQVGFPALVSSAAYGAGSSPGGIATIFGTNLAKTTQVAATRPLPTNLAGTEVKIRRLFGLSQPEFSAQLLFVSPTQINLVMPDANNFPPLDIRGITFLVSVYVDGQLVADGYTTLSPVFPGLFSADASGKGVAAAVVLRVKADGSQSYEPVAIFNQAQNRFVAQPIDLGEESERTFLLLFGTGIRGRSQPSAVRVRVGGVDSPVLFAGAQGEYAGLDQINVELPRSLKGRGNVSVVCTIDGSGSNEVTVNIK
ncbi:MAG: NF038122 family metalloprotease [Acidobacteria bacterium]|nr:NF038122 family metalloprotease [Acidobacteriota bacterium]